MPHDNMLSEVLDFWFAHDENDWFGADPAFDQEIRRRFEGFLERASVGESARDALALVILFDQFPRNIYRGTPQAFSYDSRALLIARGALKFESQYSPIERCFLYLPFEHSEVLSDQRECVRLHENLLDQVSSTSGAGPALVAQIKKHLDYARQHLVIIEKFGRFPHRNKILGRESTSEEIAFLKTPGSGF